MENKICSVCNVPMNIHNTCCGWQNANMLIHESEKTIMGIISDEEKEIRWLISQSPNSDKLFQWFLNNRSIAVVTNVWQS